MILTASDSNIGGVSAATLLCTISKLTGNCPDCDGKLLDFCMESCCSASPIFCRECSTEHLSHRTNGLEVLFVKSDCYTTEKQLLEALCAIHNSLDNQREIAHVLLETASRFYDQLQRGLQEVKKLIEGVEKNKWHDELYQGLEQHITNKVSTKEVRGCFNRGLQRLNMSEVAPLRDETFSEIESFKKLF